MDVEEEVKKLVEEMTRLGERDDAGVLKVKFGVLLRDEACQQIFEALIGTARGRESGPLPWPAGVSGDLSRSLRRLLVSRRGLSRGTSTRAHPRHACAAGTLRAAKKRKIIDFEGQMLLSPAHDDVDIVLL